MERILLEAGWGRSWVQLEARPLGDEWLVVITNTNAHIGAVAVGDYEPSTGRGSASVITLPGHRDDVIAKPQAQALAQTLRRRVCVLVGIHIEHPSSEELKALVSNAEGLVRVFVRQLSS